MRTAQLKARERPSLLERALDYSLIGLIAVVPLVMGGRHPAGYLLTTALATVAALAWLVHQARARAPTWTRSGVELLIVAGVGIVFLQLIPWPTQLFARLAPGTVALLPAADGPVQWGNTGQWTQISFDPTATRRGLILLLAYGLLFVTTLQRVRELSDVEWVLKWIALAAISMATFGIVQYLTSNGNFFWFYEHPFRDTNDVVKGAFINRNHFAHFLALGLPPLVWWVVSQMKLKRPAPRSNGFAQPTVNVIPVWLLLGIGVVSLAGLLSLSRGGVAAMTISTTLCVLLLYRAELLDRRLSWSLVGLCALVGLALAIHGAQGVFNRFDEVVSGSMDRLDRDAGRRQIWLADLQAITHFPLFGTGVGTHPIIYPIYLPGSSNTTEYTHAESGYLHVALETGVAGLAIVILLILIVARRCHAAWRLSESQRHKACLAAVCASLAISPLHSLVDFPWFIPGCMVTTLLLAACACRLWLLARDARLPVPREIPIVPSGRFQWAAGAVVVLGTLMIAESIGPALAAPAWDSYLRISAQTTKAELLAADDPKADLAALQAERRQALYSMIHQLETVIHRDPWHWRAHARLAAARLRLFELLQQDSSIPMPLVAVRDAAFQSHFRSRNQLDAWLSRAIAENYEQLEQAHSHARRAVALCPLAGEAYLYLTDLCFLEGPDPTAKSWYLAQALKVRPYDGEIQFEAGKESFLDGNPEAAIEHWQTAYKSGEEYKARLIDLFARQLAGQVPVSFFLESFRPDLNELRRLRIACKNLHLPDQWRALLEYSASKVTERAQATSGAQACALWLEADSLYTELHDRAKSVQCVEAALAADPNDYSAHHSAATRFFQNENYERAYAEVKWCLTRAPNDKDLKRIRFDIVNEQVKHDDAAAQSTGNGTMGTTLRESQSLR